jgi:hypothetical protein
MKMFQIHGEQVRTDFAGMITRDDSSVSVSDLEIRDGDSATKMPLNASLKKWTRKNACSQSFGPQHDHWLRIGYERIHHRIARIFAKSLSHASQVLPFRIRQDSANEEFISIWKMPILTIQGSRHIHEILHQANFLFSAL